MKHLALFPLLPVLVLGFAPVLSAQQPANPSSAPTATTPAPESKPDAPKPPGVDPAADPFVRDGKKSAPAAPAPEPEFQANVCALVEYIEVPRDTWFAWAAENPVKGEATALRAEVQKWIAAGKARPVELTCVPTRSGQRTVIESVVERSLPTSFESATPTPVPLTFDGVRSHLTFEAELVVGPDEVTLFSNLIPRLESFSPLDPAKASEAGEPRRHLQKANLSTTSTIDQPILVQVTTPLDEAGKPRDESRLLLFYRPTTFVVKAPPKPAAPAAAEAGKSKPDEKRREKPENSGMLQVDRYELTLADLNAWFAGQSLASATNGLHAAAGEWIKAGRGRVIDRQFGPMISGHRLIYASGQEFRYPSEFSAQDSVLRPDRATGALVNPVVSINQFETRSLGYSIEFEPVVSADRRYINLNIVVSDTRRCSDDVFHRVERNGALFPDVWRPVFALMRVTTSIAVGSGEPALLAIHTPFDEQGRPQPERKVLTFITARP
jgi:hypothetical protein